MKKILPAMAKRATRRQLSFPRKDSDHPVCVLCHGHHCQKSSPADWKSEEARKYMLSPWPTPTTFLDGECTKDRVVVAV